MREQETELSHRDRAAGRVSFDAATGGSLYAQNLRLSGRPPPTLYAQLDRPVNADNFMLTFFRHRNFVVHFLRKKSTFIRETAILHF